MPIALAALLSFLLHPLVGTVRRWGLPRGLAVVLVVGAIFAVLGSVGYVLSSRS
jgi:predicted PurR-regulated permease PerM